MFPDLSPESWYKESKNRLYSLFRKYKTPVIILSGDVHHAVINTHPFPESNQPLNLIYIYSSWIARNDRVYI